MLLIPVDQEDNILNNFPNQIYIKVNKLIYLRNKITHFKEKSSRMTFSIVHRTANLKKVPKQTFPPHLGRSESLMTNPNQVARANFHLYFYLSSRMLIGLIKL